MHTMSQSKTSLLVGAIVGVLWWVTTSWTGNVLGRDVPNGPISEQTSVLMLASWVVLTIAAVMLLNKRYSGFMFGFFLVFASSFLVFFIRSLIVIP